MGIKRLDELTAGMVLASDLKASDGRLLFKAGTELEERHIELLKRVGVAEADVEAGASDLSDEMVRDIEDYVRDFFLYVDPEFEPSVQMFKIALDLTGNAVASGWPLPDISERRASDVEHLEDLFLRGMGSPESIVKHETELTSFPDIYFQIGRAHV